MQPPHTLLTMRLRQWVKPAFLSIDTAWSIILHLMSYLCACVCAGGGGRAGVKAFDSVRLGRGLRAAKQMRICSTHTLCVLFCSDGSGVRE